MQVRKKLAALLVGVFFLGAAGTLIPSAGAAHGRSPAAHKSHNAHKSRQLPKPPKMTCDKALATNDPKLARKYCSS